MKHRGKAFAKSRIDSWLRIGEWALKKDPSDTSFVLTRHVRNETPLTILEKKSPIEEVTVVVAWNRLCRVELAMGWLWVLQTTTVAVGRRQYRQSKRRKREMVMLRGTPGTKTASLWFAARQKQEMQCSWDGKQTSRTQMKARRVDDS